MARSLAGPPARQRLNPATALGITAHEITEQVHKGAFDQVEPERLRTALTEAWDAAILKCQQQMMADWQGQAPDTRRWRGHNLARSRLTAALARLVEARRRGDAPTVMESEGPLSDPASRLHGRPDRVERHPDGIHIVDLKSGWLPGQEPLPAKYRRQLLLYAKLWHASHGEWPTVCAIQGLDGSLDTFNVDPDETERLAAQVDQARRHLNSALAAGAADEDIATPSEAACAFCPQRPRCDPYWAAIDPTWETHLPAVRGTVTSLAQGALATAVTVTVEAGNLPAGTGKAELTGLAQRDAPAVGGRLGVVNAHRTTVPALLRVAWHTLIATRSAGQA